MKNINRVIAILIAVCLLSGCSAKNDGANGGEPVKLSFKSAMSTEYLQSLDGKEVTINGYLATSSPADGSFIFLMNLPYQNCPFCIPNTSQLVNTLEVYPKSGQTFGFTNQAVSVTGTLEFAKNGNFTDAYGYEFAYKLSEAEYRIITDEDMGKNMQMYKAIADSNVIDDMYRYFDYVYFTCAWTEFFCNSYEDAEGNFYPGYYLWPSDVQACLDSQYAYANDEYVDSIISRLDNLTGGAYPEMDSNIRSMQTLAADALAELADGEYTGETQYVEMFDTTDTVYTLNHGDALRERYNALYAQFCDWINSFEM